MEYLKHLFGSPVFTLFMIIGIGMAIGSIKVNRLSLGAAGVLFFALIAGWARGPILALCGLPATGDEGKTLLTVPKAMTDLGLMMFVAAVGMQAGPRFFSVFRRRGPAYILVGVTSMAVAAIATFVVYKLFHMTKPELGVGLYTGALTNTPALAAVQDLAKSMGTKENLIGNITAGYGLAYPFSVISVTLFVQIIPGLLKIRPEAAAEQARKEDEETCPRLERAKFRVKNPDWAGKTVGQIAGMQVTNARISRVKHSTTVLPAKPDTTVALDDVVMAVGTSTELQKLGQLIGAPVNESMADPAGIVTDKEVVVSTATVIGKSLEQVRAWEEFGIVVTRYSRGGMESTPDDGYTLEPGDILRVVGSKKDVEAFAGLISRERRHLDESSIGPISLAVAVGVMIGLIAIPLGMGLTVNVSLAGAVFVTSLLLGHFGRIGGARVRFPSAGLLFAREFGLTVFLAGAGAAAGQQFGELLKTSDGPIGLAAGALVTIVTVATAFFLLHKVLKWNILATTGSISSVMTNPPALVASTHLADSDAAAIAFASLYPVAIMSKIVFVQLLYLALKHA